MKIAILNLSTPHKSFDQHGNAAQLIERWISPAFPEASFTGIHITTGDPIPAPDQFDGYILSGSEKGVYDPCDWIEPLKVFLNTLRELKTPVFGICFGHQLMADAYGGKAIKSDEGFVVGVHQFGNHDESYSAHAMHQDQVVEVPSSATVTASASYCPVAALDYDFPARSVQFHPEFPKPLVENAINIFEGNLLSNAEVEHARDTMVNGQVDESLYAQEIAAFFKHAIKNKV